AKPDQAGRRDFLKRAGILGAAGAGLGMLGTAGCTKKTQETDDIPVPRPAAGAKEALDVKIGVNFLLWLSAMGDEALGLIEKSAQMGFDGVQIFIDEPAKIDTAGIKQAVEDNGLGITCCSIVGPDRHIISEDPKIRQNAKDYMKAAIEVTNAVGSDIFCGPLYAGVGVLVGRPRNEAEWALAVEGLSEAGKEAEAAGVTLCLEPLNRFETYFINILDDAVKLAKEIDSPAVKVMGDTFHMNIEEKDIGAAMRGAGDLLCHMHCCGNDRGAPGNGHVPWDDVFGALRDLNYEGWLVIESFVLGNKAIAKAAAIWRDIEPSSDQLAQEGLAFLQEMRAG
ncbi:MAG: sugar phosphate isomerase/epimerase family protein, partial [Armatimonadota bacterium]